jgi:hypothetical protein
MAALLLLRSGSALAQQSPPAAPQMPSQNEGEEERIVTLRDGSFFRGIVVEQAVNEYVVLRLGAGDFRRIAWADIVSSTPVANASTPSVPRQTAKDPVRMQDTPKGVRVVIETEQAGVRLYRESDAGEMRVGWGVVSFGTWGHACDAPCGAILDRSSRYRIQGDKITTSGEFELSPSSATVRLAVRAGSRTKRRAGVALSSVGGSLLGIGLLSLGIGGLQSRLDTTGGQTNSRNYFIAGGMLTGVGLSTMTGGLVLVIGNRTSVVVDP